MLDRYSRQTLFGPIGKQGQERLLSSSVTIIGCGALGTVLANNLCRAGVGHLVIVDRDYVEFSNLQRQILFEEEDAIQHLPKAIAAASRLKRINSGVHVDPVVEDIQADGIEELVQKSDLILDATDNFETRYLLNDVCVKLQRPWIYSGVIASYGVTMNILPEKTPCLRCVFPDIPQPGSSPTCDTAGILNGIVGVIAGIAATESLKILLESEQISRALCCMDLWENTTERLELPRIPDCPTCGKHDYTFLNAFDRTHATSLCGRNAVQVRANGHQTRPTINLTDLAERLRIVGTVQVNQYLLRLLVENYDITIFPDGRAIIKGTSDEQIARSVYARYIGI